MANFTIDQLRALPDYAQMTKWDLTFVTLPVVGLLGFPLSESLNLRLASVNTPKASNQKFSVQTRGHKTHHSGILDYEGTMTLTFFETVDNRIFNLVKAWRELVWSSRRGQSFPKADLEATILLTLLDNQDKPRAKYTVYGAFYESDDFGSLDGSSSDAIKPTLTLSYDFYVDSPLSV
jgi:hypothetical protein